MTSGKYYMLAHHIVVQHKLNEQCVTRLVSSTHFSKLVFSAVSIKHGLRTADYGPRTGYKIRTRYKTRTRKYGLGRKHGQGIKRGLRTADWV